MPEQAEKLLSLARQEFDELLPSEERLFRLAASGEIADYQVGSEEHDNPSNGDTWGNERTLRADRIQWLGATSKLWNILGNGAIQIQGAKIEGELRLEHVAIEIPLGFYKSLFKKPILLRNAKLCTLGFEGTHVASITADGVQVEASVYLRNGFQAAGMVSLYEAGIGGDLVCDAGLFFNKGGHALFGEGLEVKGSIFFRNTIAISRLCVLSRHVCSDS